MYHDLFFSINFIIIPIIIISTLTLKPKKAFLITSFFFIVSIYLGIVNFNFNLNFYYYEIYKNFFPPFLFMVIFFIISFYNKKNNLTVEKLTESITELEQKYIELGNKLKQTEEVREILEKRLLRGDDFSIKLYDAIASLSNLNAEEIKIELLRITSEFINANSLAFYDFENGKFLIKYTKNMEKNILPVITSKSQIYDKLIKSESVLTIKDELKGNRYNLLLSGILHKKDGSIIGAILIFDISFIDLNFLNINLFKMICNWGAVEIEKASQFAVYQSEFIKYSGTEIFNFVYFTQIINAEYYKAQRFNSFFSVVNLILLDEDKIVQENKNSLIKSIGLILKKNMRICDYIFFNDVKHDRFILLLPFTDINGAEKLSNLIKNYLSNASIYPYYDVNKQLDVDFDIIYIDKNTSEEEFSNILIQQAI